MTDKIGYLWIAIKRTRRRRRKIGDGRNVDSGEGRADIFFPFFLRRVRWKNLICPRLHFADGLPDGRGRTRDDRARDLLESGIERIPAAHFHLEIQISPLARSLLVGVARGLPIFRSTASPSWLRNSKEPKARTSKIALCELFRERKKRIETRVVLSDGTEAASL